jgi:hypothetical protein
MAGKDAGCALLIARRDWCKNGYMTVNIPRVAALLLVVDGCAAPPDREAIQALPAEASLDARSLGRGQAAARPASVQVQQTADRAATIYTVSPRLQTGSPASLPLIVTSVGAERQAQTGTVQLSLLVVISNARGYGGFSRAESQQASNIGLQVLGRAADCQGAASCLYTETLLLTVSEPDLSRAAEGGTAMRIRLTGNASFVEAAVPAGHLRALAAALTRSRPGT